MQLLHSYLYLIMTRKFYTHYENKIEPFTFDPVKVMVSERFNISLRPKDSSGNLDLFNGTYEESTVLLPDFKASGMTSIVGVEYDAAIPSTPSGANIQFRVSTDGGTNFKYFDGANWSASTLASHYNNIADFDSNISTLPLTPNKSFRIEIKLTPTSDFLFTPVIARLVVYFNLEYDFREDMERSIKRYLESSFSNAIFRWGTKLSISSNSFIFTPDTNITVVSVNAVYNLTQDQNRTINILSLYTPGSKVIDLTSVQGAGDILEVHYYGSPEVYIGSDADFDLTDLPRVWLEGEILNEQKVYTHEESEDEGTSRFAARLRKSPVAKEMSFALSVLSADKLEGHALSGRIDKVFQRNVKIPSLASGQYFEVFNYVAMRNMDVTSTGLIHRRSSFSVFGLEYEELVTNAPRIVTINTVVNTANLTIIPSN